MQVLRVLVVNEKQTTTHGLMGLLGLSLLLVLWATQAIGSGPFLAGLGLMALLGYLNDRLGHGSLLVPAGLMLGLGSGLTVSDVAHGTTVAWLLAGSLFGLALVGVYLLEPEHTWALAFGGLLLICGLGALMVLASVVWIVGTLLAVGISVTVSSVLRRRRRQTVAWQIYND
jgi:hypothetical protein